MLPSTGGAYPCARRNRPAPPTLPSGSCHESSSVLYEGLKLKDLAFCSAWQLARGNRVNYLDRVAAQIPFRTPHRLLAQRMLHQRDVVVLMHMVGLSQIVPAWHIFAHINQCVISSMQLCCPV